MYWNLTFDRIYEMFGGFKKLETEPMKHGIRALCSHIAETGAADAADICARSTDESRTMYSSRVSKAPFYGHYLRSIYMVRGKDYVPGTLTPRSSHKIYTYLYDRDGRLISITSKRENTVVYCESGGDSEVFAVYSNELPNQTPIEIRAVKYDTDGGIKGTITIIPCASYGEWHDLSIINLEECVDDAEHGLTVNCYSLHLPANGEQLQVLRRRLKLTRDDDLFTIGSEPIYEGPKFEKTFMLADLFYSNQQNTGKYEAEYNGRRIILMYRFDEPGEYILNIEIISGARETEQLLEFHLAEFDGEIFIDGQNYKQKKRRFPIIMFSEQDEQHRRFEFRFVLRSGSIALCNAAYDGRLVNSLCGNFAMMPEEIAPNKIRFLCNSADERIAFNDLIFDMEISKIS